MAIKYLTAEKQTTQYFFRVIVEETKTLEDGSPNPAYVREFSWGLMLPEGQNEQQYLNNIKREIGLLVDDELARINAPVTTPISLVGF